MSAIPVYLAVALYALMHLCLLVEYRRGGRRGRPSNPFEKP